MREFQVTRYIKRLLPLILVVCTAMTIGVYVFLSTRQTYIASAVIHFNGEEAKEGLTPLGTELDVNEIKSSAIMTKVLENLSLGEQAYSVDDLIFRIGVTEVIDEDEQATKEAAIDNGEEYIYEPVTFIISFEAAYDEGESFARKVLDETLDVYFAEFSESYINTGSTVNALNGLENSNYDYIEMMEIIEAGIEDTVATLNRRAIDNPYYRSTATGKSFSEFANEFYYIQTVKLSRLYSSILENQITKDKGLLTANYAERINSYGILNRAEEEKIDDVLVLIDAYVAKMRESGNTNITYEYILDEVYEKNLMDAYGDVIGEGDQTVTYDKLIYGWRDHNDSKMENVINVAYCTYILDSFRECRGFDAEACVTDHRTCMQKNSRSYRERSVSLEEDIRELIAELREVYLQVDETNAEYNEYVGAENISVLSTVAVEKSLKVWLYTAIAAIFLIIVCCCGAVLVGRMEDIVQYVFYTDHVTGLHNRASFDSYLSNNSKKLLNKGTALATINISNQAGINKEYGREEGDKLIKFFADEIRNEFGKLNAFMVYNGNAQFIVVVERTDLENMQYMLDHFRLSVDKREIMAAGEIIYESGLSESETDDVYKIRGLLSKAYDSQEKYVSGAAENVR